MNKALKIIIESQLIIKKAEIIAEIRCSGYVFVSSQTLIDGILVNLTGEMSGEPAKALIPWEDLNE